MSQALASCPTTLPQMLAGDAPAATAHPRVHAARRAALARAAARALPTRRDERWRYTDLRALATRAFTAPAAAAAPDVPPLPGAIAARIVVSAHGIELPVTLPAGISVARVAASDAHALASLALERPGIDAFADLNAAFAPGGLRVHVAPGTRLTAPLEIAYWMPAGSVVMHPRTTIEVGVGARLDVIENFCGEPAATGLCNATTLLVLADGAELGLLHLQDQPPAAHHIALLDAELGAGARLALHAQHLGGVLARFAAELRLRGRGALVECHTLGCARGRSRYDVRLSVEHLAPDTVSRQSFRGLAGDRARTAATCRARVAATAMGADARQSLAGLLLSPHAEVDLRPEFEIDTDDVQCAHGATIGELDQAALFYLLSRGLDPAEARALLVFAFADAVLATLPRGPLREHLEARLRAALLAVLAP